jgi:hypothetical protein
MHECRDTYVSTMIAAGVDPGEVMRRMGHSTVALTLDRYTHALRGGEVETATKVQAYLDRSTVPARECRKSIQSAMPRVGKSCRFARNQHLRTPAAERPRVSGEWQACRSGWLGIPASPPPRVSLHCGATY